MTKLSRRNNEIADFGHYINNLWSAFTLLDSKEQIRLLFKDLFTHTEYKMFAKRLEIARRLLLKNTYESIQKELKVTAQTVSKIGNILEEKGEGLRTAHKRLELMEKKWEMTQKKAARNLENPFLKRIKRKTVLGRIIKAGAVVLDSKVSKSLKQRTAHKELTV